MTSYDNDVGSEELTNVDVGKLSISQCLMKRIWICSVNFA